MRFPGFIGPSYTLQSVNVDCQRCVNLFPEINALGTGKDHEVACLVPTPGLLLKLTLPVGPVRGLWRSSNNQLFAVGGNKLYGVNSSWVPTELGGLNTSSGPVSMADNGISLVLVDGQFGYSCTVTGTAFGQITDPNFQPADQVTFQDGYFIFNKTGSQQFYISPINALTPLDALDIGTAEASPDNLLGLISTNENLYLFGTQSVEVYYDSGNVFPFERIQGAVMSVGCAATFSIVNVQGSIFWLGGDDLGSGVIYHTQGYQAVRVSTPAIESTIRMLTSAQIAAAKAFAYQQGGHVFYCLNLPGTNSTWVYDASTQMWHERTYLNLWSLERHRADCHAVAYGVNIVGDYANGNLYQLDPNTYTDNGTSIARIRTAPHVSQDMMNLFHQLFQLDMEVGVGTSGTGQGVAPKAMIRWSDDGGHTWSNEYWVDIGAIGKTRTRAIWRRLGRSRDRVYEVRITDPVKVVLIGAELNTEPGAA